MFPPVGYEPGVPRLGIPTLTITAARRALPQWEAAGWRLKGGTYAVKLATDAQTAIVVGTVRLTEQRLASVRAAFDTP
jgi:beta-glucosidase